MRISRYRDLTIVSDHNNKLVIACDSSGAIGPKPLDAIKCDGQTLGRFLARVVLMELISVGAQPIVLIDTLSVEMNPTGKEIIKGIIEEAKQIDLDTEQILNGSTEENVPVRQTGAGITAIGQGDKLHCESYINDSVVCVGIPKVGNEISLGDPEICDLQVIKRLRDIKGVHEIVPVGSKGIAYELEGLLQRNRLFLKEVKSRLDIQKSAGPVTCVLLTVNNKDLNIIQTITPQPVTILGRLVDEVE